MNKILLTLCCFAHGAMLLAQPDSLPRLKIYGYVRVDACYDSRQMEASGDGFLLQYPKVATTGFDGNDLNANSMAGMTATGSRFGLDFAPFRVKGLNMNLSGRIETDFQGFGASATMLRIRHAWLKMNFGKSDLLAGQTWHPFYDNCFPNVLDLNAGLPYQPFARNPQLRYSFSAAGAKLYAVALYQTQFTSAGPEGRSTIYQKNAKIPELVAGIDYQINAFTIGFAAEYKQLQPRTASALNATQPIAVDEKVSSTAFNAYIQYTQRLLTLKAKTVYGQNLTDLTMLGGYAATDTTAQGKRLYKPFNTIAGWLTADYQWTQNSPWHINLFAGYSKNLGCDHAILAPANELPVYGNVMYDGKMLSETLRGSMQVSYIVPNWVLALEYSYNKAFYGTPDLAKGKATGTKSVDGSRVLAVLTFLF